MMSRPQCGAGAEAGAEVRRELEAKRDALVANYAAKRDALIAKILPEVLQSGEATSKRLFMRYSRGCPVAFGQDRSKCPPAVRRYICHCNIVKAC